MASHMLLISPAKPAGALGGRSRPQCPPDKSEGCGLGEVGFARPALGDPIQRGGEGSLKQLLPEASVSISGPDIRPPSSLPNVMGILPLIGAQGFPRRLWPEKSDRMTLKIGEINDVICLFSPLE